MAKLATLQNEFISVYLHTDPATVHHVIHRPVHGEPFRSALDAGVALMKQHRATRWLSDDRLNGPLDVADSDWARYDWFPRAVAAGWKFWAVVLPESIIGRMNMKLFMEPYARAGVSVAVFSDSDRALTWLRSRGTAAAEASR